MWIYTALAGLVVLVKHVDLHSLGRAGGASVTVVAALAFGCELNKMRSYTYQWLQLLLRTYMYLILQQ